MPKDKPGFGSFDTATDASFEHDDDGWAFLDDTAKSEEGWPPKSWAEDGERRGILG